MVELRRKVTERRTVTATGYEIIAPRRKPHVPVLAELTRDPSFLTALRNDRIKQRPGDDWRFTDVTDGFDLVTERDRRLSPERILRIYCSDTLMLTKTAS